MSTSVLPPLPAGGHRPPLQLQPLVCAWCDREQGVVRLLASGVSHGLCERHAAEMDAELARIPRLQEASHR